MTGETQVLDRAARAEQRFTLPVIIAALASVPAMFLTMLEGTFAVVGNAINWATLAVFTAEAVVLFVLAGNRIEWLRSHKLLVIVTVLTIPAVMLAAGPVQLARLLRFVRFIGALRVIRVRRILRAGKVLRTRAGLTGPLANAVGILVTVVAAGFVALVLADPTSESRQVLDGTVGQIVPRFGPGAVVLASLILAGSTYFVWRYRVVPRRATTPEGVPGGDQEGADRED